MQVQPAGKAVRRMRLTFARQDSGWKGLPKDQAVFSLAYRTAFPGATGRYDTPMSAAVENLPWDHIDTVHPDLDGTLLDLAFDNDFWLDFIPSAYAEAPGPQFVRRCQPGGFARRASGRDSMDLRCAARGFRARPP